MATTKLKRYPNCDYCYYDCTGLCAGLSDKTDAEIDAVNQPEHYARWKMQPVEFCAVNDLPWWMANVIKYIMRYDAKDGLQDLRKARSYLDMQIRKVEGVERWWEKPVAEERRSKGE